MGVADLLTFLRSLHPELVQECNIDDLKGQKIAFDLAILCYQKKSDAVRRRVKEIRDPVYEDPDYDRCTIQMVKSILDTIKYIIEGGCIPVMVFDGKPPSLKTKTKEVRAGKSMSKKENIAEFRRICKNLLEINDYKMTKDDIEFIQKFQKRFQKKHKRSINSVDDLRELIRNELNQYVPVKPTDYLLLSKIFALLGVPRVYAPSEAEQTCSQMCRMKEVAAIFTTDSDCMIYGCPIMINKISFTPSARRKGVVKFQCYTFQNVLKVTNFTFEQFIDFCILLGTDFNDRISGYGPPKHFHFISKYKSFSGIENARKELENKPFNELSAEERLLYDYDTSTIGYTEVHKFLTTRVSYDKSMMDIEIEEGHFETIIPHMIELLGNESLLIIIEASKRIVNGLIAISKSSK